MEENSKPIAESISIEVEAKTYKNGSLMDGISANANFQKLKVVFGGIFEETATLRVETRSRAEGCGCGEDPTVCGCPKIEATYTSEHTSM